MRALCTLGPVSRRCTNLCAGFALPRARRKPGNQLTSLRILYESSAVHACIARHTTLPVQTPSNEPENRDAPGARTWYLVWFSSALQAAEHDTLLCSLGCGQRTLVHGAGLFRNRADGGCMALGKPALVDAPSTRDIVGITRCQVW